MSVAKIDRREFLAGLGVAAGSLTLGVRLGFAADASTFAPNAFVSIAASGAVSIVCHRSEMGQGVRTAMPMIVADELGADWSRVEVVQAVGDKRYGGQNTDGSRSVRGFLEPLRQAGAVARAMLIQAAARTWRAPASRLRAEGHQIVDSRGKRAIGFGELVATAAALPVPKDVALRPAAELKLIGSSKPIVDGRDITAGAAVYAADVRRPGMLTAVIERPPAVGDAVESVDDRATRKIPGVRDVIRLPVANLPSGFAPLGGVAVVADDTWAAMRGRQALAIKWKPGPHRGYESKAFRAALEKSAANPGVVARKQGDADRALAAASTRVEASYYVPHLAQAPMEPPCAVAAVSADGKRCEVWASVQTPQRARAEVAAALGIDESAVTVNVTLLGGGFGRKSKPDFVVEAALLSKRVKAPVRVQWTRTDDLRHGFFHTVSAQRLEAAIKNGVVTAWRHRSAFPTIGATFAPNATHAGAGELGMGLCDVPFAIPNITVENGEAEAHLRIGWMRSVANIYHGFAVGSFVDEIAVELERDAREVWLELLGPDRAMDPAKMGITNPWNYGETGADHFIDTGRMRAVIEAVCSRAGWDGRGDRSLGLAAHRSFASYVAVVIEVDETLRPVRAWSAIDCGLIVHRDRVSSQLEGAVIYGLSLALHGEITAAGGRVQQANFDDYRVLRMNESPLAIETVLLASDRPPGGVGEPGTPPVAAAYANAVFAATGKRLRELPIRPGTVRR